MARRKRIDLLALCRYRWSLPLLAAFGRQSGWRVAPLLKALGASRGAFRQSLEHLLALRLLRPNPGHGHPLRPEYLLVEEHQALAAAAAELDQAFSEAPELLLDRWALPLLLELQQERRFGELRSRLEPISDRALSLALDRLATAGILQKKLLPTRPPAWSYTLALDPPRRRALAGFTKTLALRESSS